jgi:hypothetical protein
MPGFSWKLEHLAWPPPPPFPPVPVVACRVKNPTAWLRLGQALPSGCAPVRPASQLVMPSEVLYVSVIAALTRDRLLRIEGRFRTRKQCRGPRVGRHMLPASVCGRHVLTIQQQTKQTRILRSRPSRLHRPAWGTRLCLLPSPDTQQDSVFQAFSHVAISSASGPEIWPLVNRWSRGGNRPAQPTRQGLQCRPWHDDNTCTS